jgi:hypothetical protein
MDVFISYAREDAALAQALADELRQEGFQVWIDDRLRLGQNYPDVITKAVRGARRVIVLWSRHAAASSWVPAEAHEGYKRQVLVPVQLDETELPLPFSVLHAVRWPAQGPEAFQTIAAELRRLDAEAAGFAAAATAPSSAPRNAVPEQGPAYAVRRELQTHVDAQARRWRDNFYLTQLNCTIRHHAHEKRGFYRREVTKSFAVEAAHLHGTGRDYDFLECQTLVFPPDAPFSDDEILESARITLGPRHALTKTDFAVTREEKNDVLQVRLEVSAQIPVEAGLRVQVHLVTLSAGTCDYEYYKVSRPTRGYRLRFESYRRGRFDHVSFIAHREGDELSPNVDKAVRDSHGIEFSDDGWLLPGNGVILLRQPYDAEAASVDAG